MGDLFGPNIEDIDTIRNPDGSVCERIIYSNGRVEVRHTLPTPFYTPASTYASAGEAIATGPHIWTSTGTNAEVEWRILKPDDYHLDNIRKHTKSKEERKVEIERKKSHNSNSREYEHTVTCCNEEDLAPENILKTLSAVKGELMINMVPICVKRIECCMTPQVRKNIVTASKRLKMYGKKRPIIASFDEYGNRLPDEIDIGGSQGITLKIIEPEKYGPYYLALKGLESPDTYTSFAHSVGPDTSFVYPFDLEEEYVPF